MKLLKRGEPGPKICWHCGRHFMWVATKGGRVYAEVRDPLGHIMRVHGQCVQFAVGDGVTEVKDEEND